MGVARKYLPATLLRLKIRLEDFTEAADPVAQTEDAPFKEKLKKLDNEISVLVKTQAELNADLTGVDKATVLDIDRQLRKARRARKQAAEQKPKPASQSQEQGDAYSIDLVTVPTDMTVELNGPRIADTMTAKFPFRDAPLISDIIRAAQVDVIAGTVPMEDFGNPQRWRLSFKPTPRSPIMFRGYVDSWDTDHTDSDSQVEISARSLEAILIDGKINPLSKSFRINGAGEKISIYVNRILAQFPGTSGKTGGDQMRAVWYGADPDSEPTLSQKTLLRTLTTAKSRNMSMGAVDGQAPPVADSAGLDGSSAAVVGTPGESRLPSKTPAQETSVWDLITQACNLAGCIPVYDPSLPIIEVADPVTGGFGNRINPIDSILLRPPQTMFEDVDGGTRISGGAIDGFRRDFKDPSSGARVQSDIRFMVWGHNIKSMHTSRKLGRIKAPAVEVRCENPDAPPKDRLLVAKYPSTTKRGTRIGSKGEAPIEEIVTRVVRGIRSTDMLMQIAVGLYHAMSRQELSVKISTDDLASYIDPTDPTNHNDDPDLLRLRSGSPCRIKVAREVKDPTKGLVLSPLSEVFEKRTTEISRFLREQAGRFRADLTPDEQTARVKKMTDRIATALTSARLTDLFYCRTVSHTWNVDDGWSADIDLVNFLEARSLPKNLSETDQKIDQERRMHHKIKTPAQASKDNKKAAVARYDDSLRKLL